MTSRRNFLRSILVAGASFAILPGAGRIWHARRDTRWLFTEEELTLNPDWVNAPFGLSNVIPKRTCGWRFPGPVIFPDDAPMGWLTYVEPHHITRFNIDPESGFLRKVEKWI